MQATVTVKNTTQVPVFVCGNWIPAMSTGSVPAAEVDGEIVSHYLQKGILELHTRATRVEEKKKRKAPSASKKPVKSETTEEHKLSSKEPEKAAAAAAPKKAASATPAKKRTRSRRKPTPAKK